MSTITTTTVRHYKSKQTHCPPPLDARVSRKDANFLSRQRLTGKERSFDDSAISRLESRPRNDSALTVLRNSQSTLRRTVFTMSSHQRAIVIRGFATMLLVVVVVLVVAMAVSSRQVASCEFRRQTDNNARANVCTRELANETSIFSPRETARPTEIKRFEPPDVNRVHQSERAD